VVVGRDFKPLMLEEMKRIEPGAFEKVEKCLQSGGESVILNNRGLGRSTYNQPDIQQILDDGRHMGNQEPDRFREVQPERLNSGEVGVTVDEEKVAKALRTVELSMKDVTGHETGAIVGRDGTVIREGIVGKNDSISPPEGLVKNNIFTHPHHNGMCNLSDADVIFFIIDDAYEVRVVTPDGRFVSLKKGNGDRNKDLGKDMRKVSRGMPFVDAVNKRTLEKYGKLELSLQNKELESMMNEWLSSNAGKYGYIYTQGRHEL